MPLSLFFFSLPSPLSLSLPLPLRNPHAIPRHTTQTTLFRNRRRVQAEQGGVRATARGAMLAEGARAESGSAREAAEAALNGDE